MSRIPHPEAGEYAPFYAGYIAGLNGADPLEVLARQVPTLRAACAGLSESEALHRYAPDKWSVKEVVGHISDTERVFAYRALRIGRDDATPLAGFDENRFVAAAGFDARPLAELIAELEAVRAATLALLRGLGDDAWERRGTANGMEISVRALVYIMAGHAEHHLRMLADRYGVALPGAGITAA